MTTHLPVRRLGVGLLVCVMLLLVGGPASAELNPSPPPGQSIQDVQNPTADLLSAAAQVDELATAAQRARDDFAAAAQARDVALEAAQAARAEHDQALARAERARAELGSYAASAYINGGATATLAATLAAGTPTEALARQNSLDAVAANSTDLVRVLKDAQAQADVALRSARSQQALAEKAAADADAASQVAAQAAADAEAVLAGLVHAELLAQQEAMLRARAAAYATGPGAVVDAKGVPVELLQYGNGHVPAGALSPIGGFPGHMLWAPAARSFEQLVAAAAHDGVTIGITDSYRPYEVQVSLVQRKGLYSEGGLAATPGTSDHGWGIALDLVLDSGAQGWMRSHAAAFGWVEDVPREPWHWAYYITAAP